MRAARRSETLVIAAFGMAVLLLAIGAWSLWRAGVKHRSTADEALRDQASYIAGSIAASVQQQGVFAARTLLHAWSETLDEKVPWPGTDSVRQRALREAIGPDMPDLIPSRFFAGDENGWRTTEDTSRANDPELMKILERSRDSLPKTRMFRMLEIPHGTDTSLVFVMAAVHPRPGLVWYGFDTPLREFREKIVMYRLASLASSFRMLRDSLRQQPAPVDSVPPLAISIETIDGLTLYATPVHPHPPWIGSRWITGGLAAQITVSVEDAAVPVLMSGGYPGNPAGKIVASFAFGVLLLTLGARLSLRTLALSRQREEFTSSVSHELRTPLTNIQLFAETLLLDRARTPDEQRSALETITRETRRLVHMVENVLSLSRVGRPAVTLVRRPERVDQLVRDVLASFDPLLRSRDISVEVIFDGEDIAHVDGDAVRRILVNLLDNAVRYGPEGQTLRITAVNRNDALRLTVEDEGPGIPVAERERVWQPFERGADNALSGTGIGLAVVRQLVLLHGGDARIESGLRGARIEVFLPCPFPNRESAA
jgi:signal transduction histidine kinase